MKMFTLNFLHMLNNRKKRALNALCCFFHVFVFLLCRNAIKPLWLIEICMFLVRYRLRLNGSKLRKTKKNAAYKLSDLKELSHRENVEVLLKSAGIRWCKAQHLPLIWIYQLIQVCHYHPDGIRSSRGKFYSRSTSRTKQKMEPGAAAVCQSGLRAHGAADTARGPSSSLFIDHFSRY